jgi:glycosyltransferase involved in cell wall biosynthesis
MNEEATVEELVARLATACPDARLVFVDNASSDGTATLLARMAGVTLLRHPRNLGYGRSLATGLAATTGDRVVMLDGDLEYLPEDVPRLAAALDDVPAVWGSRFLAPDGGMARSAAWSVGNRLVTRAFNLLFDQRLTDLYTGIRGVRRSALPRVPLRRPGFEFVLELAVVLTRAGIPIAELPIGYTPRRTGKSKMRHAREVAKFVFHLARLRLQT